MAATASTTSTMCILCHNSASNEKNVRVGMGVDASEAYDGKVGETFEMKTMLHRVHSAGAEGQPPYVIYREPRRLRLRARRVRGSKLGRYIDRGL